MENKEAEIFYLFTPVYWGKGLAVEACSTVINEIFRNSTIQKIKALILPENLRAQRVAEKIGFKFRKEIKIKGYQQKFKVHLWSLSYNAE